jgi:hypothetical protein
MMLNIEALRFKTKKASVLQLSLCKNKLHDSIRGEA